VPPPHTALQRSAGVSVFPVPALPASREHCFTSDVPLVVENRTKRKISDTLSGMSLKRTFLLALFLAAALPSTLAQGQGRRPVLEESLQARYRLTILGGGIMGARGGDNAIRRVGGIVMLVEDALYGSYRAGRLARPAR